jgi:hypothetical protein
MGGPAQKICREVGELAISYRGEHAENGERVIPFHAGYCLLGCETASFQRFTGVEEEIFAFTNRRQRGSSERMVNF